MTQWWGYTMRMQMKMMMMMMTDALSDITSKIDLNSRADCMVIGWVGVTWPASPTRQSQASCQHCTPLTTRLLSDLIKVCTARHYYIISHRPANKHDGYSVNRIWRFNPTVSPILQNDQLLSNNFVCCKWRSCITNKTFLNFSMCSSNMQHCYS